MRSARISLVLGVAVGLSSFAGSGRAQQQPAEPEILPPPPGEIVSPENVPRQGRPGARPAPVTKEEITLYGVKPLGREVPMHIRAMFESNARGEAQRQAAFANQKYILNHVAWMNGLPSPFVGQEGQPSLDYVYSGLGRSGPSGGGLVFEPWPYVPGDIWGYPFYDTIESPVGHRITWRGPNAYTYEPVYAGELKHAAPPLVEEDAWPEAADELAADELPAEPAAPPDVEPVGVALAQAQFVQQQFADASATLRAAINDVPREELAAALNAAGRNQFAAAEWTGALRALEAAIAADRQNADLRLLLAWQYYFVNHAAAAIHQLDQALKIDEADEAASVLREALSDSE